jgi:hypothetical protein
MVQATPKQTQVGSTKAHGDMYLYQVTANGKNGPYGANRVQGALEETEIIM